MINGDLLFLAELLRNLRADLLLDFDFTFCCFPIESFLFDLLLLLLALFACLIFEREAFDFCFCDRSKPLNLRSMSRSHF